MNTYPTYPQPILNQSSSGLNWYLELDNAGTLAARARTTDPPTAIRDVTLVSTDRTAAYRFGLDASNPPAITLTQVDAQFGNFEDLYVFSPNGREWSVKVDAIGATTITALGLEWPRKGQPILKDAAGVPWRFEVADGGVLNITSDPLENHLQQPLILRTQDDSKAWQITVNTSGILSVSDDNVSLEDTELYEAELVSPSNERWMLHVDVNGILSMTSITDLINSRDSWPLVLAKNNTILYVVDSRFRNPWKGSER